MGEAPRNPTQSCCVVKSIPCGAGPGGIGLVLALDLSACTNPYDLDQRAIGGFIGAGAGAAIGAAAGDGTGAAIGAASGGASGGIADAATTPPPPPRY